MAGRNAPGIRVQGRITEAVAGQDGASSRKWRVRIINSGTSGNHARYPLSVLHEAKDRFDGAKVLVRDDDMHVKDLGKNVRGVAGFLSDITPVAEGLDGTLNVLSDHDWLDSKIGDALSQGRPDLFGLSIVAEAAWKWSREGHELIRNVSQIRKVMSVDVVVDPSAGGKFMGLAEATEEGAVEAMKTKLLLIEAKLPKKYAALDLDNLDEAEVDSLFAEAVVLAAKPAAPRRDEAESAASPKVVRLEDVQGLVAEAVKQTTQVHEAARARDRAEATFERLFAESVLPDEAHDRVLSKIQGTAKPADESFIAEAIKQEVAYLAKYTSWRGPNSTVGGTIVESMVDGQDKWKAALVGLFMEADQPIDPGKPDGPKQPRYQSLRAAYQDLTGDRMVTGRVQDAAYVGLSAEAAIGTGTWGDALVDAMNKRMQMEYKIVNFEEWKALANVVPVSDFRTNYRPQLGGFGDLDTVAASGDYVEIGTSPSDFGPSYSIGKKGNIKGVTLEAIANDDVGAVRQIPVKLGRAAKRTLSKSVWNTLLTNANVSWEAVALCAAGHGSNISTSPLSPAAIIAGRLAMAKQTEPDSGDRLQLRPRHLIVPEDLAQKAWEYTATPNKPVLSTTDTNPALGTAATGTVENMMMVNFIQQWGLQPLVCPHATDAYKWWLAADKRDIDMIEVGFFGGKEEPELFVQDMPNVGSMFTNDEVTMKIRFIYGVGYLDYRGFFFGNATS